MLIIEAICVCICGFFCTFASVFIKNSNKKMDDYPADNYNS